MLKQLKRFEYSPPKNGYPEWNNNPEILQLNRLEAHAKLMPFQTVEGALKDEHHTSDYYKSLNGQWKFSFSENPENRSLNFFEAELDSREVSVLSLHDVQIVQYLTHPTTNEADAVKWLLSA